jgi:tRNA nucleotidyltransferase/poly(A) polymerase
MDFIEQIVFNGGEVYSVGGCVRDRIFNGLHNTDNVIKDFDILVAKLKAEKIIKLLKPYGNVKEVGKSFGIINLHHYKLDKIFEIALPRKERSTGPKYRDFEIVVDPLTSIEIDLSRRDSTINAIAYRIYKFEDLTTNDIDVSRLIDPFDGITDIKNKIWKAVGDPLKRFLEDPTRILRAIRQCATLGLTLDHETKRAIYDNPAILLTLKDDSLSRLTSEIVKTIKSTKCSQWIQFIFDTGVGKILSLDYTPSEINKIVNSIEKCGHYVSKLAILLAPLENTVDKWTKKYSISSANTFDCKYTDILGQTVRILPELHNMVNSRETKDISEIEMRRLIQKVQKQQYDFSATQIVLDTYICYYNQGESLVNLYEREKNIILNQQQLALSGEKIGNILGANGKKIGAVKQWLFNEVTEGYIINETERLIDYLHKNIDLFN